MSAISKWSFQIGIILVSFGLGYFFAPKQGQPRTETSSIQLTEGFEPKAISSLGEPKAESMFIRQPMQDNQVEGFALREALLQVEKMEGDLLESQGIRSLLEDEVLTSDQRVSRLEQELEQAFLDPESSPFGSFLKSSVGLQANALERLLILRVLQDIPVVLSETESVWLLENLRNGGLEISYRELVSTLGPFRVQEELSKKRFAALREGFSNEAWTWLYPGFSNPK
ncbi:MAG: hypothetical protein COA70_08590 [Planctomycetota bacterium]|nr:MAG: hypothetical protein COA70_08590 [Planctomycetota bacterium]